MALAGFSVGYSNSLYPLEKGRHPSLFASTDDSRELLRRRSGRKIQRQRLAGLE